MHELGGVDTPVAHRSQGCLDGGVLKDVDKVSGFASAGGGDNGNADHLLHLIDQPDIEARVGPVPPPATLVRHNADSLACCLAR